MVLVIDNYDSFTYNLVQYVGRLGVEVEVRRNDQIGLPDILGLAPAAVLFSPGPCTPDRSGVCLPVIQNALSGGSLARTPIFGVCLGHQAIGQSAGGKVGRAANVMHGKTSLVQHDGLGVFQDMPQPFQAVRYHSLVVERENVPEEFLVTASSLDDDQIMGLRHKSLPIESVQFHPESVLTQEGSRIIENFLRGARLLA